MKQVSELVSIKEYAPGSLIIHEGDVGDDIFLLEKGVVDVHKTLTIVTFRQDFGTKERSFIRLTGEDHCFFGEMGLFGKNTRSATVKAVTQCSLMVIKGEDLRKLFNNQPRIGYAVVKNIGLILSDHLRKTNEDVFKLTTALSLALSGEE